MFVPIILASPTDCTYHCSVVRNNDTHSIALCRLLVALGEHSNQWFATRLDTQPVQTFMNLVLVYTGFPGYYGIDEEESETTLSFWYLLQESLWEATYPDEEKQEQQMGIAKELYREVVNTLRRKVTWPANPIDWDAGALNDPVDDLWLSVLVRAERKIQHVSPYQGVRVIALG